jgi:hypothetical protein
MKLKTENSNIDTPFPNQTQTLHPAPLNHLLNRPRQHSLTLLNLPHSRRPCQFLNHLRAHLVFAIRTRVNPLHTELLPRIFQELDACREHDAFAVVRGVEVIPQLRDLVVGEAGGERAAAYEFAVMADGVEWEGGLLGEERLCAGGDGSEGEKLRLSSEVVGDPEFGVGDCISLPS